MYKRHNGQVSMLESPEMFGSLPPDPDNEWIKLSKLVPWREFDLKYADNFRSKKGQQCIINLNKQKAPCRVGYTAIYICNQSPLASIKNSGELIPPELFTNKILYYFDLNYFSSR